MHLTFTPDLYQVTVVPLSKLPQGETFHTLTFKASFDSPAAYNEAKANGARVEMWTDLPTSKGEAGGWRAIVFEYADLTKRRDQVEPKDLVFDCITFENSPSPIEDNTSVYATVKVPATLVPEGSMFSFTYRVVFPSGHIQWLGAYGQNGILEFAKRDMRGDFITEGNEVKLSGAEEQQAGCLNLNLKWERWAVDDNGYGFTL